MRLGTGFAAAAAGGAAYAFAFEPYALWPLAWFALVPLLTAQAYLRRDFVFAAGLLFGLVHAALSFSWMFGIFGPLTILLFSIYGTYFALAFLFVRASTEAWGNRAMLWSAPIAWVAIEWLRSEAWWLKFSWFTAGSSLAEVGPLLQPASIVGAYGLSALIVFANSSISLAIVDRTCRWIPAVPAALVVVAWIAGAQVDVGKSEKTVHVALVEGEGILLDEFARRVDEAMRRAPETQLVVLPEYATPSRLREDDQEMMLMRDAAKRHRVTLVFGGTERTGRGDGWHNMLFVVGPDGDIIHRQAKSVPIPFFRDGLPAPARVPGDTPAGRLGFATCYDMDFPFVARELVRDGAELLVFPTMDAETWGRVQHRQHAALAPLRAVEHRRWLVRCASSGESMIVDPYGAVIPGSGIVTGTVELRRERTPYERWGWRLPHLCAVLTVLFILGAAIRETRNAKRPTPVLPP